MYRSLIQKIEENDEEEDIIGVPVCGGNLSSPVADTVNYIEKFITK
jgi:hypothetical protein